MAGPTTELRREIKERFIPFLTAKGFTTDNRHAPGTKIFRRAHHGRLHICDLQWEKYGKPRFILNFGETELQQRQMDTLGTWDCETYLQLKPKSGASTATWFRQDKPWPVRTISKEKLYPAASIITLLIDLFAEAENFWQTGCIGQHVNVVRKI